MWSIFLCFCFAIRESSVGSVCSSLSWELSICPDDVVCYVMFIFQFVCLVFYIGHLYFMGLQIVGSGNRYITLSRTSSLGFSCLR